jgi:monooxygenase
MSAPDGSARIGMGKEAKAIADGPSILNYVKETASEYGIDRHIRYRHQLRRVSWSSEHARWTVEAERGEAKEPVQFSCGLMEFS